MRKRKFANAVALIGAALQFFAALLAFAPEGRTDLAVGTSLDVSSPGREATSPQRLHYGPRRGNVERPPRKPSGSARAAPVHSWWDA